MTKNYICIFSDILLVITCRLSWQIMKPSAVYVLEFGDMNHIIKAVLLGSNIMTIDAVCICKVQSN